jgi:hypothetical protein
LRPQPQMVGPNARRIVAPVQNLKPIRYRAMGEYPGSSMRTHLPVTQPERAVSGGKAASSPKPTAVGLLNLRPEPLFRCALDRPVRVGAGRCAIKGTSRCHQPLVSQKILAAMTTGALNLARLGSHPRLQSAGAMPPDVPASRWPHYAPIVAATGA